MSDQKIKNINIIKDMNSTIQVLQNKTGNVDIMESQIQNLTAENDNLRVKSSELRKWQVENDCQIKLLRENITAKQEIINILKTQLQSNEETKKCLENNLTLALQNYRPGEKKQDFITNGNAVNPVSNVTEPKKEHSVVIYHDSLCKNIKNTIMVNENVKTTKIWAPTLHEIQENVENMDKVDTIVIEALTRHLRDKDAEDIVELVNDTVEKCLTKGEKVVISSIIKRDDEKEASDKAEKVNLHLRYKYLNHSHVSVCNNDNLDERKFRLEDGVHLTE